MAQFYSLEEAARVLGMSAEELKAKAQLREIRAFLDGGSWRFRALDIDELARRRGLGSDAELPLSDLETPAASGGENLDDLDLSEFHLGVAQPDLGNETMELRTFPSKSKEQPSRDSGSDHDILFDDLSVPPSTVPSSSSVIIGMQSGNSFLSDSDVRLVPEFDQGTSGSDVRLVPEFDQGTSGSDVRLVPEFNQGTSGSDVRLVPEFDQGTSGSDVRPVPEFDQGTSGSDVRPVPEFDQGTSGSDVRPATPDPDAIPAMPDLSPEFVGDPDVTLVKDDSADHGLLAPPSVLEGTALSSIPFVGSSGEIPVDQAGSESNFELNPSSDLVDALVPESGSDFELALEGSDEFESTPRRPGDSDVTAADPNLSGINLSHPSDSGINLQTATEGAFEVEHHDSIELAPLSDAEIKALKSSEPSAPAKPAKAKPTLAPTPPPAFKEGEKDIFDESDYEVDLPISDEDSSEDKTLQLDTASSDFELEESEDRSEVFAIDEEEVDQNAATAMSPSAFAAEEDEDDGFEEAVSREMASAWSSGEAKTSAAGAAALVISREMVPEWGGVWVGVLSFATLFLLFAAFIAVDLLRNLYDFRETPLASGLVRTIASIFGG